MTENKLREFLDSSRSQPRPTTGQTPIDRVTIQFGSVIVNTDTLGICDVSQVPSGIVIECPSGEYELEAECYVYGNDARVARVTAKLTGTQPAPGALLGTFGVDMAMAAVFDNDALMAFVEDRPKEYASWINNDVMMYEWESAGTLVCEPVGVEIPYFEVGFGDGRYRAYALEGDDQIVGIEAVFLDENAPYF